MELARFVVDAVVLEGRSLRDFAPGVVRDSNPEDGCRPGYNRSPLTTREPRVAGTGFEFGPPGNEPGELTGLLHPRSGERNRTDL